jgi:hypothetical protein
MLSDRALLTVRVHEWDQVEVIVVEERCDKVVFAITIDELVRKIFDCHCGDPLASVCGTMP